MFKTYAAVDLLDGQVVRLSKGAYDQVTHYGSPYPIMDWLSDLGFDGLHIINLNGAKGERLKNLEIIKRLIIQSKWSVQVGGGIRTQDDAERLLALGSDLILSTAFFEDFEWFESLSQTYPKRICLSLDIKDGVIKTHGWLKSVSQDQSLLLERLKSCPIKHIILTQIDSDGMLQGIDVAFFEEMRSRFSGFDLMAAGGVTTQEDIDKLKALNYQGAIVGKALYEGMFLKEKRKPIC